MSIGWFKFWYVKPLEEGPWEYGTLAKQAWRDNTRLVVGGGGKACYTKYWIIGLLPTDL